MELSRNLRVESVSRLNPTAPRQVPIRATVAEATSLMRAEQVGCLLVCDATALVGVFTERDLLCRVLGRGKSMHSPIVDFMTPNPVTVHPKDPIRLAIKRMIAGGYRHLPVTDDLHRPIGILSIKRIAHYLVEHFPATVYNLPPHPNRVPDTPEGA